MASNTATRQYIRQNTQEENRVSERSSEGYLTLARSDEGRENARGNLLLPEPEPKLLSTRPQDKELSIK